MSDDTTVVRWLVRVAMWLRCPFPTGSNVVADVCRCCGDRHHSTNGRCDFTEFKMRLR